MTNLKSLLSAHALLSACCLVSLSLACTKEEAPAKSEAPAAPVAAAPVPAAAPSRDVCPILSGEQLKASAGVEAAGTASRSGGADVCTWMGAQGKGVVVQVFPSASRYEEARKAFERLYKAQAASLDGVGDQAFTIVGKTGPMNTATVAALQGQTPVSVQVMAMQGSTESLNKEAVALTRAVLGAL